jgi:hypothetical protein
MKYARVLHCKNWSKRGKEGKWNTKVYAGLTQHDAFVAAYRGAVNDVAPDDIDTAVVRRCDASGTPFRP